MIEKIKDWLRSHETILVLVLVLIFLLVRLPGTSLPLHQDEYKWLNIKNAVDDGVIPHPPLGELIYQIGGHIVGFNVNFRFVPLFFGALNLLLLYYLVRTIFDRRVAVTASLIWIFSYFSVLASLMIDTDGEIMPFFFLLALIGYYKSMKTVGRERTWWIVLLALAFTGGFFIKVSFLLAIGAIAADFLWSKRNTINKRDILRYTIRVGISLVGLVILLILSQKIFPFFNLASSFKYWEHFFTLNRGWFQTFIQCVKATLYLSPLLVLLPFFVPKERISKVRVFIFFLIFAFIFYIVLFDFSLGALDRYLELLILPLTVMTSIVLSDVLKKHDRRTKEFLFLGVAIGLSLVLLQSLPHYVPPLHPKSEWIGRILSFKWNFLYPFSGGSGPLGFYVSFLFIALAWIISFMALVLSWYKPEIRKILFVLLIPLGLAYSGVFIEEYLVGHWNGHAPDLLRNAVEFIKADTDIKMVTVYNDNGGYEIRQIGKYHKRLYVDPKFDINEKVKTLNMYKEYYFVLDVPRIDPTSIYRKYFSSCSVVYNEVDKNMSATIYDCRGAPDIKI